MTHTRITLKTIIAGFAVALVFSIGIVLAQAQTQSIDPVADSSPVPEVLGASIDASIDPVMTSTSADPLVLGASTTADIYIDELAQSGYSDPVTADATPNAIISVAGMAHATAALNVRISPSRVTDKLGTVALGTAGTILEGPSEADGLKWYKVSYGNGLGGWSAGQWLEIAY